jgi:transcriptional regulator with PAS, ATPase and Fis domain
LKPEDLAALRSHNFPGNVRELRNLLERSLLRTEPDAEHVRIDLAWLKGRGEFAPSLVGEPGTLVAVPPNRQLTVFEQQEYEMIAKALRSENGGIRRSAAKLGLTHQALLRRLQKWPELRQVAAHSEPGPSCKPA